MTDPFETAPNDDAAPEVTVVKSAAVGGGEGKIVSTYKEGAGFDASWTVVHAASVDDWFAIHEDPRFPDLLSKQKKVAEYFRGGGLKAQQAAPATPSAAPAGATAAPGGETRFCSHGAMVFKSGVAKNTGKPYSLFSCPAPRDQQCKAQFL